jgi:SAM-dependent methyltransferase
VQGDAEALPFEDAAFHRVLSTFGIQFAPRHEHAAAELARVSAPGAILGLCNWTPASFIGQVLTTVGRRMPAPPPGASPPPAWGDRDHVRALLGDAFELSFDTATADFTGESAEQFIDFFATWYGPLITARTALGAQGRWDGLREELIELATALDVGGDGGLRARSEYLVVTGVKR